MVLTAEREPTDAMGRILSSLPMSAALRDRFVGDVLGEGRQACSQLPACTAEAAENASTTVEVAHQALAVAQKGVGAAEHALRSR